MHEHPPIDYEMHDKLYLTSHKLIGKTEILECYHSENERYVVRLDKTLFHPQGGGQPCDKGTLNGHEVLHVTQNRDGQVLHYLPVSLPLGPVEMNIDQMHRLAHARLHTAGHLIGHLLEQTGWQAIKAHHWPGEARLVFRQSNNALPPSLEDLSARCREQIQLAHPISIHIHQGHRQIVIGKLGQYPCGGTHVENTAELNGLTITRIKNKKDELSIHYEILD